MADSGHGGQVICTKAVVEQLEAAEQGGKIESSIRTKFLGKYPYEGVTELMDIYQVIHPSLRLRGVQAPGKFPELRIDWDLPNAKEATNYPKKEQPESKDNNKDADTNEPAKQKPLQIEL